jgi:hypothetical protein
VAGFDAESYLREAAERWVSEGGTSQPPWNPILASTGAALVAVDAMITAAAQSVIDDYNPTSESGTGALVGHCHDRNRSFELSPSLAALVRT